MLAFSFFFSFYDITSIGVALPVIAQQFHLTGADIALPVSLNLFGYAIGAYLFGTLADYIGRRRAYQLTMIFLTFGALLTAFSWNDASLSIFRLLTGVGTGAQISLSSVMITELAPGRKRGNYVQANQIVAGLGIAGAPFLAEALIGIPGIGWRIVLGFGALAVIPLILAYSVPESPRWLILHNRGDEAKKVMADMESRVSRKIGGPLPEPKPLPPEPPREGFPTFMLFRRPFLGRLIVVFIYWFAWYITTYSFLGLEPTILGKMGLSIPSSIAATALSSIGLFIGPILAWLVIDRMQRKYLLAAITALYTIGGIVLALSTGNTMLILGGFIISLSIMAGTSGYTYTAEIFPTDARASAMSIADGIGHLGGAVGPIITVAVMTAFGARMAFWEFALFVFISSVLIFTAGERTHGKELSELNQMATSGD